VARGGRKLLLESFDGRVWHKFSEASTTTTGVAMWKLTLHRGRYRIRALYAGASDLGTATSNAVTIRIK
jgi:hypothetical protein